MLQLQNFKTALTFFAHPDDETLAAGGTIKKLTDSGVRVRVAIPATGIHSRRYNKKQRDRDLVDLRADCENAMKILGISDLYLGEFADNELDKYSLLELIHWIEPIIEKVNPDLIFTHHRYCTNIDHQKCHEAIIVATRMSRITILCGEVPSSTGYLKPVQWEPNLYVDLREEFVNDKITAMETYKGEARDDPHPRSKEVLKALAKVRGSEAGFNYAEAFMIAKTFL